MDETIARLNINHYRSKLAEEKNEAKRQSLTRLLAEEEQKLAEITKRQQNHKRSG